VSVSVFVVCVVPVLVRLPSAVPMDDMAEYVNDPVRLAFGDLPYADFWLLFPPGEVALPWLVYRTLSRDVTVLLALGALVSALVAVVAFHLGRLLSRSTLVGVVTALLVFWTGVPGYYVGPTYLHVYLLWCLVAATLIVVDGRAPAPRRLELAGACLGVAMLFRVYEVGAAALAMGVAVLATRGVRPAGRLAAGGALVALAGALAMAPVLRPFVADAVLGSVAHATAPGLTFASGLLTKWAVLERHAARLVTAPALADFARLLWDGVIVTGVAAAYVFPAALVLLVALAWRRLRADGTAGLVAMFVLWAAFALPKGVVGSSALSHWAHVTTPAFFALAAVLGAGAAGPRAGWHGAAVVTAALLLLPVPGSVVQAFREYAGARVTVAAPFGAFRFRSEADAAVVSGLVGVVERETRPGDYIFVAADTAPALYALTGRRNPTRYGALFDLLMRPGGQADAICEDLARRPPRLIVQSLGARDAGTAVTATGPLQRCLAERYDPGERYGDFRVHRPRDASAARR